MKRFKPIRFVQELEDSINKGFFGEVIFDIKSKKNLEKANHLFNTKDSIMGSFIENKLIPNLMNQFKK